MQPYPIEIWHASFFPIHLPSAFFRCLTFYKLWQISLVKAPQNISNIWMDLAHVNTKGAGKHTPTGRLGRVIWLEWTASVKPRGKSAVLWCVIGRLSEEVCACVCVHVTLPHTWVIPEQCPGCIALISVWGLFPSWASTTVKAGGPLERQPLVGSFSFWVQYCVCVGAGVLSIKLTPHICIEQL